MAVLTARRFLPVFGKAELGKRLKMLVVLHSYFIQLNLSGGAVIPKYICSIFFVLLWVGYLTLSGLQAYGHIKWQI